MIRVKLLKRDRSQERQRSYVPLSFRRTTTMFPSSTTGGVEPKNTVSLRFHQLMVALEADGKTGCLKVESQQFRSRSALLLYRGRVVGCIYGQKGMLCQYMGGDALTCTLSDLATPGNLVEAYELPEELVLAASALFCGQPLSLEPGPEFMEDFERAMTATVRSGLPGCVVLTSSAHEAVCVFYIFSGTVCGVHSATKGWLTDLRPNSLRQFVRELGPSRVLAAILPATEPDAGLSLTGLTAHNGLQAESRTVAGSSAQAERKDTSVPSAEHPKRPPVHRRLRHQSRSRENWLNRASARLAR